MMAKHSGPPPGYVEVSEEAHGTQSEYRRGCRCDRCRKAHTDDQRERRHRKSGPPVARSSVERFWEKVCETDDCWLWTASLDTSGYGLFRESGKMLKAHRWSYTHYVGTIPEGLTIDHLCSVRNCVRPDHLEAVTAQENTARRRQSHCLRGHEFTEENTHWVRTCRACWQSRKDEAKGVVHDG